jgi:hypothetical protein
VKGFSDGFFVVKASEIGLAMSILSLCIIGVLLRRIFSMYTTVVRISGVNPASIMFSVIFMSFICSL